MFSFVKKTFPSALPWILLCFGILSLVLGTFVEFNNERWEKFLTTFGSSILASGIFALILKSIQFLGVFKEELIDIIYETKYLKNRTDLHIYWEKVTKVLVKDKFPNIHSAILKDVKDTYLPTTTVQYYDNCIETLEIKVLDVNRQVIQNQQTVSFTVIPSEPNISFVHPYSNILVCSKGCVDTKWSLLSVKVNNQKYEPIVNQERKDDGLYSKFDIDLSGKGGYRIEITVLKIYSLKQDHILSYRVNHIHNNFKVQIFAPDLDINFVEVGTLINFKTIHNKKELLEKEYNGLLYKRQGYLATLRLRN